MVLTEGATRDQLAEAIGNLHAKAAGEADPALAAKYADERDQLLDAWKAATA